MRQRRNIIASVSFSDIPPTLARELDSVFDPYEAC